MTCPQEIIQLLKDRYPEPIHKGNIFGELADLNYMPDTISRTCRKLAEEGRITRIQGETKGISYLYKLKDEELELWKTNNRQQILI